MEQLLSSIKQLSEFDHSQIFYILSKYNVPYTQNNNGVFVECNNISSECWNQIADYLRLRPMGPGSHQSMPVQQSAQMKHSKKAKIHQPDDDDDDAILPRSPPAFLSNGAHKTQKLVKRKLPPILANIEKCMKRIAKSSQGPSRTSKKEMKAEEGRNEIDDVDGQDEPFEEEVFDDLDDAGHIENPSDAEEDLPSEGSHESDADESDSDMDGDNDISSQEDDEHEAEISMLQSITTNNLSASTHHFASPALIAFVGSLDRTMPMQSKIDLLFDRIGHLNIVSKPKWL